METETHESKGKNVVVRIEAWFFLIILILLFLALIGGCASTIPAPKAEDSTHYVAQIEPRDWSYGPRIFERGWWSDVKDRNYSKCWNERNWKISPDGQSGSMSSTTVRTYGSSVEGGQGSLVGPAGWYGGFCGY